MKTSGISFLETQDRLCFERYTNAGSIPVVKVEGSKGFFCKFCGIPVPASYFRKYYCSGFCFDEMMIRSGFYHHYVNQRDKFICAHCGARGEEIDHIIPVIEGGGSCGLDNLRTLCRTCHKEETAKLRRRRKEAKAAKAAKN